MTTGKVLNRLFPNVITSSHWSINHLAYNVLQTTVLKKTLPTWQEINVYEGLNGVDGLWLRNQLLQSHSTYNPLTQQGNGIIELQHRFNDAMQAWQNSSPDLPKRLAYLSHIITDLCTPPHQHGKITPVRTKRWYFFWTVQDDWLEDTRTDQQWIDQHTWFELNALFRLAFRLMVPEKIDDAIIQAYQTSQDKNKFFQDTFHNEILKIRELDLFSEYQQHGWTQHIATQMHTIVIPKAVSLVATLWYLVATNLSVTTHNPLITR